MNFGTKWNRTTESITTHKRKRKKNRTVLIFYPPHVTPIAFVTVILFRI